MMQQQKEADELDQWRQQLMQLQADAAETNAANDASTKGCSGS
jgi:hypothetical protein